MFLVCITLLALCVEGKRKRKFEGDFEFADEDDNKSSLKNDRKRWIHDPESELCRPLSCKKKEMCLLDETMAAFCVNKKQIHKNGDVIVPRSKVTEAPPMEENDEDDLDDDDDDVFYDSEDGEDNDDVTDTRCKPCPIVQPTFICGADNRTYSSLCRLDYHNCIHRSGIKVSCKGFCPCKDAELHMKRMKQTERMNNLIAKYKNTVEREKAEKSEMLRPEMTKPEKKLDKLNKLGKVMADKKKHLQDKYSFVPKEFKYDNQHYKYIKYKYNKPSFQEDKEVAHNEVLDPKPVDGSAGKECNAAAMQAMGNRLLDWFSVVMADSKRRRQRTIIKGEFPLWCKPEVRWMFAHLDTDGDELLSLPELIRIERDKEERCIKSWIDRCDVDGDLSISHKEWCRCFDKADRPCSAAKRSQAPYLLGAYVPECDSQGFYVPTQCHTAVGMCWCVDKHGVEFANSRSRSSTRPNCLGIAEKQKDKTSEASAPSGSGSNDDDDDEDEDDSEVEGSADQPLDF